MKNVMWKGELHGNLKLDTISNKTNLYGLGPVEYLAGEILIIDGIDHIGRVFKYRNYDDLSVQEIGIIQEINQDGFFAL